MAQRERCPKHKTRLMLRQDMKTGKIALACPLCDVGERGGGEADRKTVSDVLKKFRKEDESE
ncbi:MAG TPA: hypothetical protein VFA74_09315 [Terriglobales bacterium]|nr:hypothetical protein [Terriglobales bacterium]